MTEEARMTRDIHNFVRGNLDFKQSIRLLEEIIESDEWLKHLEMDMLIYSVALKKCSQSITQNL